MAVEGRRLAEGVACERHGGKRPSSIEPNSVVSREAPPNTTVSLNSQRLPEKLPEVTGTSRGNPEFPEVTRERLGESFFNVS